ncbi:hypothetical protein COCON_G00161520 [Conger conger]|uniref:Uncharacterized protein n=1 Tax=Conger conger TaxID=82655 RepID=A0A9Q1HVC3_CONCO|nr:hypothetical protein COCON_G00161520 [Conger conger]
MFSLTPRRGPAYGWSYEPVRGWGDENLEQLAASVSSVHGDESEAGHWSARRAQLTTRHRKPVTGGADTPSSPLRLGHGRPQLLILHICDRKSLRGP